MPTVNYTLTSYPYFTILMVPGTVIRVLVYDLANDDFKVNKTELQLFGYDHSLGDRYFAFEIKGWQKHQLVAVTDAIKWYCRLINLPDMELSIIDPRPMRTLALV